MANVKLSRKYQIVVPREVRRKMKLQAGAHIAVYPLDEKRAVLIKQSASYVDAIKGLGADMWSELGGADAYIRQERASWQKK